jgi:hypothetical protein
LRLSPNKYNKLCDDIRRNPTFTHLELIADSSGMYETTVPVPVSTQIPFVPEIQTYINGLDVESLLLTIKNEMGSPLSVYDARLQAQGQFQQAADQQPTAQPFAHAAAPAFTPPAAAPAFTPPATAQPFAHAAAPAFTPPAAAPAFTPPAAAPAFTPPAAAQQPTAQPPKHVSSPAQPKPAEADASQAAQGAVTGQFQFPQFGGFVDGNS